MKSFKKAVCIVLSLLFIAQLLTACSSKKTDADLYLSKGEFFAYFVHEYNLTSEKYTVDDIQNCEDGSVEGEILVEWDYLAEEQATKGLKKPVSKEIVVTVCANATFDLKQGNTSDIKDSDLLNEPQLIADAYASGFFELENGYFDGAKKMTLADCDMIIENARNYTSDFHYSANSEITETDETVIEQDSSGYQDGDIIIEIPDETGVEQDELAEGMNNSFDDTNKANIVLLGYSNKSASNKKVTLLANDYERYGLNKVKSFTATIMKHTFENELKSPKVGETVILNRFQLMLNSGMNYGTTEIIGVLKDAKLVGNSYVCLFEYPQFEDAIEKKNIKQANGTGIDTQNFKIEKSEYDGWKFDFDISGNSIKVDATKAFTTYETGRKQDWQNSKKTINAKASFEVSDFNIDINNLKSFASKKGKGYIKITCDTDMSFELSTSLRYTPDSNRNGKFPSNWNNSRWTDSGSKGAKEIKIARFSPSLYGVASVDVYIYLQISVDGKISFRTSIDNGGMQMSVNNGKIALSKLGKKTTGVNANINLHGRLGIDASLKIFGFINVIEYDVGADLNAQAIVDLYYEKSLSKQGVFADEEGLNEYRADDSKFNYCIGIQLDLGVSGKLKDSGVKLILNALSKGDSLNFEISVWNAGLHFEDGSFVEKCTRGNKKDDEVTASENDDITLGSYKVVLEIGQSEIVSLKSLPSKTLNLMDSKNAITVKSNDNKIAKATYNKASKSIIVEATGEGSTEIVITAKKGSLWWKKTCEQKVSITVKQDSTQNIIGTSYVVLIPQQFLRSYSI